MEEWDKSGSDNQHHFTITDSENKTTPRVTGKTTGKTYEEWKKLLVHTLTCTHTLSLYMFLVYFSKFHLSVTALFLFL